MFLLLLLEATAFCQTYNIEVEVRDEANAPISDMIFTVDGVPVEATLNAAQNFVIPDLPEGKHFVKAAKLGWNFNKQEQSATLPTNGETYSPNGIISFSGQGAYSINGQVYRLLPDGTRQGLRNFNVSRDDFATSISTDLDGNYALGGLTPGTYTIQVASDGFEVPTPLQTVTLEANPGDVNNDGVANAEDLKAIRGKLLDKEVDWGILDANQDSNVDIADLIRILNLQAPDTTSDFVATGSCMISGSVRMANGTGIEGVAMVCTGSDGSGGTDIPYASVQSDADGNYMIDNLPPGIYTVIPVGQNNVFSPASVLVDMSGSEAADYPHGHAIFTATDSNDSNALLPLAYYFVQDSDGTVVMNDGIGMLIFEPNGIVDLYVAITDDAISYQGTYVYKNGQLTIDFEDPDFTRSASISFDPTASSISLPFTVFSGDAGSSTWNRQTPPLEGQLLLIFKATFIRYPSLYFDEAMARVLAYAQAINQGSVGLASSGIRTNGTPRKITVVKPKRNGVVIKYDSGLPINLVFFSWANSDGVPLTMSPLAGDPRLNLDTVPTEQDFDPENRTALFIMPFFTRHNLAWYDATFHYRQADDFTRARYFHFPIQAFDNNPAMVDLLENKLTHPYTVTSIKDDEVTLPKMIDELLKSPGFIYYSTHGGPDGTVSTGIFLGDTVLDTPDDIQQRISVLIDQWSANPLYRQILEYKRAPDGNLTTLSVSGLDRHVGSAATPAGASYFLDVTPNFWEALRVVGHANFEDSLVYIAACETDQTPTLRQAIHSRAYFGFSTTVPAEFAGSVFQYLCKHMARRTHSSEEAYYNIIRVAQTRLMIYTDDALLQTTIPRVEASAADQSAGIPKKNIVHVKDMFRAYGVDRTTHKLMTYQNNGWLTPARKHFEAGAVWWLLFASRWGGDAQDSRDAMMDICWKEYWSRGSTGGLANPSCQNMSPGRVPYTAEFSYMAYLLTGQPYQFATPKQVPRWTLNDMK